LDCDDELCEADAELDDDPDCDCDAELDEALEL